MRRFISVILVMVLMVNILGTSLTNNVLGAEEADEKIIATLVRSHDGSKPRGVRVFSTEELESYIKKYHDGKVNYLIGFEKDKYDDSFFEDKFLYFSFVKITGSSPMLEVTSINETENRIEVNITSPDSPTSPDMASWILILEMEHALSSKVVLVSFDDNPVDDFLVHDGELVQYNGSCEAVIIPDDLNINHIRAGAFENCSDIMSVIIPDSITSIAPNAFGNDNDLTLYSNINAYAHEYALEHGINWRNSNAYMTDLSVSVRNISYFGRNHGDYDILDQPKVTKITSVAEIADHFDNKKMFDGSDEMKTVLMDKYDNTFFDHHFLVFISSMERSGANELEVVSVHGNNSFVGIGIKRTEPDEGTPDIVFWHMVLEVDRTLSDRQFNATFSPNVAEHYLVTTVAETGGSVFGSGIYGTDEEIKLSAATSIGYTFAGWFENGEKIEQTADLRFKVDRDRTLEAKFTRGPSPFADVAATEYNWYYDAVCYCLSNGYFNGTGDQSFTPNGTMNRAMASSVLNRLAGEPEAKGSNPFPDVEAGEWYTDAVIWAAGEKIIEGYGDGTFGTNDPVTREQLVTMLWRYQGKPAGEEDDLAAFIDAESISSWAKDAFAWAVDAGVIQGKTGAILDPKGTITRAEVAQVLMNYDNLK